MVLFWWRFGSSMVKDAKAFLINGVFKWFFNLMLSNGVADIEILLSMSKL